MFLPVNNDSCDLLVHEYQDCAKESWDNRSYHSPPGIGANGTNNPSSIIPCWLKGKKVRYCFLYFKLIVSHLGKTDLTKPHSMFLFILF
jgi:hypothetical protein